MARCKSCADKRKQLRKAVAKGDVKETVRVAVEGVKIMVGFDAGKIKVYRGNKKDNNG